MSEREKFDLIVIGTGPGGYVAAVRATQLGMKVACIEKEKRLGGVCLNVGCIPSKALLDSSEYYHLAKSHFADHGITTGEVKLNLSKMMKRKEEVVNDLTDQVRTLLKGNDITIVEGTAELIDRGIVKVTKTSGKKKTSTELEGKNILLATGSKPITVPGIEFDGDRIVSSTEALSFKSVPKKLGIVGGGYIGLELGSVWSRLGSEVSVIEMLPKIAANLDGQVNRALERVLKSQGMNFYLNTKVAGAKKTKTGVKVELEAGGKKESKTFDRLLVAIGRRPLTEGLGLDNLGIKTNERTGHIEVDENYQTSVGGIFAIGDLIAGPMLAHKASAEGVAAVETMAGLPGEVNYDVIPAIVYTWPEVASVGLTEEQVKERGIEYNIGTYPFSGTGRARCMGEKDGFVKLISQAKTDRVLGVHIIGPRASDMIAESGIAMEFSASSEDIARTIHGHPTFAEALQEAATNIRKVSIYAS
ncbi:MAG: dihydrolipoyl dehydrogenase [Proteobacteria bacterium]|nr:dihydrolipoyl dehydrogenase [Pseudomonadota bacterium]